MLFMVDLWYGMHVKVSVTGSAINISLQFDYIKIKWESNQKFYKA